MRRENHFDTITRPKPDEINRARRSRMGQNLAPVFQPQAPFGLGKLGQNFGYHPIRFPFGIRPLRD